MHVKRRNIRRCIDGENLEPLNKNFHLGQIMDRKEESPEFEEGPEKHSQKDWEAESE
jgi:hypothetical protein